MFFSLSVKIKNTTISFKSNLKMKRSHEYKIMPIFRV
jgi:hypothetical protein